MVYSGLVTNPVPLSTYQVPASDQISINTSGITQITFNGRGLASGAAVLTVCDARGASSAEAVAVNPAGYVQVSATRSYAPDGSALSCP